MTQGLVARSTGWQANFEVFCYPASLGVRVEHANIYGITEVTSKGEK